MTIDAKGLREKAVRLWGVAFPGEGPSTCSIAWTPSVSVPVLCDSEAAARRVAGSIPSTPSRTLGTKEYALIPADLAEAVLACVEAARTAVNEWGLCGSLDALEAALAGLGEAGKFLEVRT